MNEYRRIPYQAPQSYEELNRNRPTKKRNYHYSAYEEPVRLPVTNNSPKKKEYHYEDKESPIDKSLFFSKEWEPQVKKSPKRIQPKEISPQASPSSKYDIGLRLTNISSINDKITDLLNVPRPKRA
jgi:hypothetical protein